MQEMVYFWIAKSKKEVKTSKYCYFEVQNCIGVRHAAKIFLRKGVNQIEPIYGEMIS